ncbi:MAG: fused MFS/spermidine synthase [Deltaproteobacteria bacterium]
MTGSRSGRALATAYAATVFLGAFLLFQVQPLIGKAILPWFGGSPAVWTTCMLVFQALLFSGYLYAHVTTRYLSARHQAYVHLALLLLALVMLPIAPSPVWKPTNGDAPVFKIILVTVACVGLPFFILSSTGPLVQRWFSLTHAGESPYRLYSLSNLGSLLALLSYPFVVEPVYSTVSQSYLWSGLFAGFAALCAGSAAVMWRRIENVDRSGAYGVEPQIGAEPSAPPTWNLIGLWFGLAMVPSVLLLATTNRVCLDVAVVPFLWIVPLALYLISFILCFDGERWYSRRPFVLAAGGSLLVVCWLFVRGATGPSLLVQVAGYFSALFFAGMVCHGELAALKPAPRYLTTFYLTISAGGAAGGLFVGLLAPLMFVSYFELQLGVFGFGLTCLAMLLREDRRIRLPIAGWLQGMTVVAALVCGAFLMSQFGRHAAGSVAVSRNFYGVLKVEQKPAARPEDTVTQLFHGWVIHGTQFVAPEKRRIPTAYYAATTGIGQALSGHHPGEPRHVGIVGLGVGTLAAYGQAGDRFRFYEINPDVIAAAHNHFTFLSDSPAEKTIVQGDARLALEFEEPQEFDILVLDAFSGDAIPVHLLTREAMGAYLKHLKSDGLLACHISNLHFDLRQVVAGLAKEYGLAQVVRRSGADPQTAAEPALWVLLARNPQTLAAVRLQSNSESTRPPLLWTDDCSNLLQVLWSESP